MNFRSLFTTSKPARRFQGRQSQGLHNTLPVGRLERLEERALLAGNVTAQLLGQTAVVNGDMANNSVQIFIESGNVVVRGLDGTTINGTSDDFILASGTISLPGHFSASLGDGNDTLTIAGVTVSRNAAISGGQGNDQIAVMGSSVVSGDLTISGGSGADTISLQDSTVGRTARILGGKGTDTLVVSSASIGRDLFISGGSNDDNIVVDSTRVERDARISGNSGDDDIVVRDSVIVDDIVISGNAGHDIIVFDSSAVGDKSFMRGGSGSDNIQIIGTSQFFDRLRTYGGAGRDNIETAAGVTFDGLKRSSFSGRVADAAAIEARINNTVTGAIAAAEAAVQAFDPQLTLTLSSSSISEGAGNGASTLTITRASSTDADLEVTLTSSNPAKLSLNQNTVTILAGQSSATVLLNPQNDSIVGNDTVVTVTATANGLNTNSIDVTITDDDAESLSVAANVSTIAEDTGSSSTTGSANTVSFTITRTGDLTSAQVVNLAGSPASVFDVPATATIAAGDAAVTIDIPTIVNTTVGNDVTFTLTASAPGLASANASVIVLDNDSEQLSIAFSAPTITETGSDSLATLTVTRNSDTTNAMNVTVTSQNPESVTFSGNAAAQIVIPAGATSASIAISGVDETIDDGDLPVAIIASAIGFSSGSETIVAINDDVPTLSIALSGTNVVAENAGIGAVSATISRNTVITSTDVVVSLASTGDSRLLVPTSVTIPAGQSSVIVFFDTIDNNIVDVPADGTATITALASGFVSGTTNVTITNDDAATISLSPSSLSVSETAGVAGATLTLSRTDSSISETVALAYSDTTLITGPASVTFNVGDTSASVVLDIIDNDLYAPNEAVTVTASASGHADVLTTIGVTNDESLSLTVDTSTNTTVQSVGALITRVADFTITGQTAPGATVQIDTNGDAAFDEASTTADQNGNYAVNVTLTHDDTNGGRNLVQVRSLIAAESVDTLSSVFDIQLAIGTVVRLRPIRILITAALTISTTWSYWTQTHRSL